MATFLVRSSVSVVQSVDPPYPGNLFATSLLDLYNTVLLCNLTLTCTILLPAPSVPAAKASPTLGREAPRRQIPQLCLGDVSKAGCCSSAVVVFLVDLRCLTTPGKAALVVSRGKAVRQADLHKSIADRECGPGWAGLGWAGLVTTQYTLYIRHYSANSVTRDWYGNNALWNSYSSKLPVREEKFSQECSHCRPFPEPKNRKMQQKKIILSYKEHNAHIRAGQVYSSAYRVLRVLCKA